MLHDFMVVLSRLSDVQMSLWISVKLNLLIVLDHLHFGFGSFAVFHVHEEVLGLAAVAHSV